MTFYLIRLKLLKIALGNEKKAHICCNCNYLVPPLPPFSLEKLQVYCSLNLE